MKSRLLLRSSLGSVSLPRSGDAWNRAHRTCVRIRPLPSDRGRRRLPVMRLQRKHFFTPLYQPVRPGEYLSHFSFLLTNGYFFLFLIFC